MEKLFLLTLLPIVFSSSVECNENIAHESKGEPLYFTEKEYAPACFYTEDNFQGESVCLEPPMMIDFYNSKNYHLNDKISSIKIPEDVQVSIYKNDNFNHPYYKLMESINLRELEKIDMSGQISAATTHQSPGFCDENCVILTEQKIELEEVFNKYLEVKNNTNKLILMNFEVNRDSDFSVGFIDYPLVLVVGNDLFFYTTANSKPLIMRLKENTDNLSLLFKLNEHSLQFQYLAAKGTEPLNIPFWINTKYSYENLPTLYISNGIPTDEEDNSSEHLTPLILNKTIIALNKHPQRSKRGFLGLAACVAIPVLAIWNLVTHGHCNQLDRLVGMNEFAHDDGEGKTVVVAGPATPLPPVKPSTDSPLAQPTPATLILTHLNTHLHHQALTLPAVAKACNTSVDNIIGARYPRQIKHSCSAWMSSVLEDFTLLFGASLRTWSTEYLIQTLNGILDRHALDNDHDAIDAFIREPAAGHRLIRTVNNVAEIEDRSGTIDQIAAAFSYAEFNYTQYLTAHSPPIAASTITSSDSDSSCSSESDSDSRVDSPLQAQQYPLGAYLLTLANYVPQDVNPLILRDGTWVTPQEGFDIEIIHGTPENTRQQRYELMDTLQGWRNTYNESQVHCNSWGDFPTQMDTTRYAGQTVSQMISRILQNLDIHTRIAVVRFNNQIINISTVRIYVGSEGNTNTLYAEDVATVTNPAYVLTPDIEGTIRRSGTAGLHKLIQQLIAEGVKTITSEIASQPSALVHRRLGFSFFTGEPPASPPPPSHDEL